MYIRCFDVEWQEGSARAVPRGVLDAQWQSVPDLDVEWIPVVFIRQDVFLRDTSLEAIRLLAAKVLEKVKATMGKVPFRELQIDCDWTEGSRERYFAFLKDLKDSGLQVSSTLRLWQSKYRTKAGIPPCDRVTLMVYNLEKPTQKDVQNSILDVKEVQTYLGKQVPYPLPMDIALPLFSWAVHFRNDAFLNIFSMNDPSLLKKKDFFEKKDAQRYLCIQDTLLGNHFVREGDELRYENATPKDILAVKNLCWRLCPQDTVAVTLFHFDATILSNHYTHENVQSFFQTCTHCHTSPQ
jgi:hypothetical protein